MPSAPTEHGFLRRALPGGGAGSRYVVYVPDAYDGEREWPLILFLHGRGEEGTDGWRQVAVGLGPAIMLDPRRWPFIAVFPQKPADRQGWLEYESQVMRALAATRDELRVDSRRIYLTGVSLGGFGSWMLAPRHRDVFAAIAPVCGGGEQGDAAALRDLPIWAFHGEADDVVAPEHSRRMVEAVRRAGGHPRLTVYPRVGHDSWDPAYRTERLPEWLLEQRLP